jgi:primosomal protein N'
MNRPGAYEARTVVNISLSKSSFLFSVSAPLREQLGDRVRVGYDTDEKCLVVQKAADDDIFSFNIVPRRKNARSGMLSGSDVKGLVEWLKEKEIYGRYLIKYDKTKDVWKSTESI